MKRLLGTDLLGLNDMIRTHRLAEMASGRLTRRALLSSATHGLGAIALASLLGRPVRGLEEEKGKYFGAIPGFPHHEPRAKHVIFLTQSGGPSQLDLFDPKPGLNAQSGQEIPESIRKGQRLTTMTADQTSKPIAPSPFKFQRHGESGLEFSELLPYTARMADELCVLRSLRTDAINHDPGMTQLLTGVPFSGHPSMGSWISYGLGNETEDLPTFVALFSGGEPGDQPLSARLWGSAFLPSQHQGVRFHSGGEPVMYLQNPPGIDPASRRDMLDTLGKLNRRQFDIFGDPEIAARTRQFEMAGRMQFAVPALVDLSNEPEEVLTQYGADAKRPGSYAANCLLARRLVERGVRFVQLFHRGWDHHDNLVDRLKLKCQQTDQASAALVEDLRRLGLLKDTLIVWAGEFGRTVFSQGDLNRTDYGRDHHPGCFSAWLAGGGIKRGMSYGITDDFSYNVVENPVHIHDLQATILHVLGIEHTEFTVRYQGRDHRLTDIGGNVVHDIVG
jgi:hypothetical protein